MYIKTIDGGYIYPDEPQLGKLPDEEEIVEDFDNEIVDYIKQVMADDEYDDLPEYVTMTDSLSGVLIDILVEDYMTHHTVR